METMKSNSLIFLFILTIGLILPKLLENFRCDITTCDVITHDNTTTHDEMARDVADDVPELSWKSGNISLVSNDKKNSPANPLTFAAVSKPIPYTAPSKLNEYPSEKQTSLFHEVSAPSDGNILPMGYEISQPKLPALPRNLSFENLQAPPSISEIETYYEQAVARVQPSVVYIEAVINKDTGAGRSRSVSETGSGILTSIKGRYVVLTNAHVVGFEEEPSNVKITLANRQNIKPIRTIICDRMDLAVLELSKQDISAMMLQKNSAVCLAPFGDSETVQITNTVFSVGNPFGLSNSVSRGSISARDRRNLPISERPNQIQYFLQTDTPSHPGNSGGPLINVNGEVIGMITAIASKSGLSEGVAFALPINLVLRAAHKLVEEGKLTSPYCGIELDLSFDTKQRAAHGIDHSIGTHVLKVYHQSPAAQAGLQPGDVIVSYNKTSVYDNEHFVDLIALSTIGDQPQMVIQRNKMLVTVSLQLTPRPSDLGVK